MCFMDDCKHCENYQDVNKCLGVSCARHGNLVFEVLKQDASFILSVERIARYKKREANNEQPLNKSNT